MEPWTSFAEFQNEVFASLMATTKTTAALASEDLSFHRSLDPSFASSVDKCNKKILSLANSLLKRCAIGKELHPEALTDPDDVETHWRDIVEVLDSLLEKADTCLDEYTGAIKQKNPEPVGTTVRTEAQKSRKKPLSYAFRNRNIPKPQLQFKTKVDNSNTTPFKPILKHKPHATVPLEESIGTFKDDNLRTQYFHPYNTEIEQLKYPKEVYQSRPPIKYQPFESTTGIMVNSEESLLAMFDELKRAREIAIDLEHHNERSYVGFVCLMQISTREKDWIIDTLKLREELQILNEVFADPNIVKVLHGAFMDIVWLQRDFGLYIVGLFDTYEAAKVLGFPGRGLAFLLKKYIGFDADKQYQLADWRIRPLPQEMLDYARSDTHFLLYCYDEIRNELVERSDEQSNLIEPVLLSSKKTSLKRYEREAYDVQDGTGQNGWRLALTTTSVMYSPEQITVFKALHEWRDNVARTEDEGIHYVMPRHQLFNLVRLMPEDVPGILRACHPVSPCVRLRVEDLLNLIREARDKAVSENHTVTINGPNNNSLSGNLEAGTSAAKSVCEPAKVNHDIFSSESYPSQLRGMTSNFWGAAVGSTKWTFPIHSSHASTQTRLTVPLPPLTAAIFLNPSAESKTPPAQINEPGSRAEHEFVRDRQRRQEDKVIIVKQVGGPIAKRKREEVTADDKSLEGMRAVEGNTSNHTNNMGNVLGVPQQQSFESERKKKRKEQRSDDLADAAPTTFKPFDYTKATSVLNGKSEERAAGGQFNPYSKLDEGPKARRERRREKEGKSFTFHR